MLVASLVRSLRVADLVLHRIDEQSCRDAEAGIAAAGDARLLPQLRTLYMPRYDGLRRQTKFGFFITSNDCFVGLTLLAVSSWENSHGYTTTDIAERYRGRGFAPGTKPHLFHLGFSIVGLNRIEAGCSVANVASKRSLEKTAGFVYEGRLREYARNPDGGFDDEERYAIVRRDWERLYAGVAVVAVME